ncbi:hypothetical protein Trisim1_007462 [Trichoderma cf. simile WF8]
MTEMQHGNARQLNDTVPTSFQPPVLTEELSAEEIGRLFFDVGRPLTSPPDQTPPQSPRCDDLDDDLDPVETCSIIDLQTLFIECSSIRQEALCRHDRNAKDLAGNRPLYETMSTISEQE